MASLISTSVSRTSSEESSWNTYIVHFLTSQKKRLTSSGNHVDCSPSVGDISARDASRSSASSLSWQKEAPCSKKVKVTGNTRGLSYEEVEDELADTATSPFSNQKVEWGPRNISDVKMDEQTWLGLASKDKECSGLERKGLCLVPLSMLAEFFVQKQ